MARQVIDISASRNRKLRDRLEKAFNQINAMTEELYEGVNSAQDESGLSEQIDDRVASLIQDGTGISWSYNDAKGRLTPTVSLSPFTTTNLAEGTNLYYTDGRVQTKIDSYVDQAFVEALGINITESQISDLVHYTNADVEAHIVTTGSFQTIGTGDSPTFASLNINGTEVIDSSRNASFVGGTFTGDVTLGASADLISSGNANFIVSSDGSVIIDLDRNNNDTGSIFRVIRHGDTGTTLFRVSQTGFVGINAAQSGSETLRVAGDSLFEGLVQAKHTSGYQQVRLIQNRTINTTQRTGLQARREPSDSSFLSVFRTFSSSSADQVAIGGGGGMISPTEIALYLTDTWGNEGAKRYSVTYDAFQTDNFSAGSTGWQISYAGGWELGAGTARGTIDILDPGSSPSGSQINLGSPNSHIGLVLQRGDGAGGVSRRWDTLIDASNRYVIRDNSASSDRLRIATNGLVELFNAIDFKTATQDQIRFTGGDDTIYVMVKNAGAETRDFAVYNATETQWLFEILENDTAKLFGNTVWHAGNLTPITASSNVTWSGSHDFNSTVAVDGIEVHGVVSGETYFTAGDGTPGSTIFSIGRGSSNNVEFKTFSNNLYLFDGGIRIQGNTVPHYASSPTWTGQHTFLSDGASTNYLPIETINQAGGTGTNYSSTVLLNHVDPDSGNNNRYAIFRHLLMADHTSDTTYEGMGFDFYGDNHFNADLRGAQIWSTNGINFYPNISEIGSKGSTVGDADGYIFRVSSTGSWFRDGTGNDPTANWINDSAHYKIFIDDTNNRFNIYDQTNSYQIMMFSPGAGGNISFQAAYDRTTGSAANVQVNSAGFLKRSTSSFRYKEEVETLDDAFFAGREKYSSNSISEALSKFRPVHYKHKGDGGYHIGLGAEDVHHIMPELCMYDDEGNPDWVQYPHLTALLVGGWQKHQSEIEQLQAQVLNHQKEIDSLKTRIAELS